MTIGDRNLTGGGFPGPDPFLARDVDRMLGRTADPVDQAIEAAGWINHNGPRPHKHVSADRTGGKFRWELQDHAVSPHDVVASGRAWTRRGARRAVHKAHLADLIERALKRPGARDRRDDGLVW